GVVTPERLAALLDYWRPRLETAGMALDVPLDFPRSVETSYQPAGISVVLGQDVAAAARELGRSGNATLFMTLLTAWKALLSRYTGSKDVAIATPVAGRSRVEFEKLIGLFTTTLLLRT